MMMTPYDDTLAVAGSGTTQTDSDWWRGAVIYHIYPRSYRDTTGDGIGDLPGVVEKLDYVASLGVDALWLSPFFTSPMKDFGYDVSDYCDVDPMFGTLADFDRLVEGAHARGLKVLIDLVLSHTSDQHPWFTESRQDRTNPKADWYVWADPKPDGTPPTNWPSIFGGSAWEWNSKRRQYYMHNFLASQPDLNFHCEAVRCELLDTARFWLDRGVDGFRLDTVNMYTHDRVLRDNPPLAPHMVINGIPPENPYGMQEPLYNINRPENLRFVERLREVLDDYGATTSVGEIGAVTDMYQSIADYTTLGRLHMAYSFDFMTPEFSATHVRRVVERMATRAGEGWPSWAFSNHDVPRVLSRWGLDAYPEAAPLLVAIASSLRGSACLYQGEELGLPEAEVPFEKLQDPYGIRFWPEFKGRDGCRTPMPWDASEAVGFTSGEPWLPAPEAHRARSVAEQEGDPSAPLNRVRRFLAWRKSVPALLLGEIAFQEAHEPALVFTRSTSDQCVLCAMNLSQQPIRVDLPGLGRLRAIEAGGFEGGGRVDGGGIELGAWGAVFAAVEES